MAIEGSSGITRVINTVAIGVIGALLAWLGNAALDVSKIDSRLGTQERETDYLKQKVERMGEEVIRMEERIDGLRYPNGTGKDSGPRPYTTQHN